MHHEMHLECTAQNTSCASQCNGFGQGYPVYIFMPASLASLRPKLHASKPVAQIYFAYSSILATYYIYVFAHIRMQLQQRQSERVSCVGIFTALRSGCALDAHEIFVQC